MNAVYGAGAERPLLFTSGDALNLWWNTQVQSHVQQGPQAVPHSPRDRRTEIAIAN